MPRTGSVKAVKKSRKATLSSPAAGNSKSNMLPVTSLPQLSVLYVSFLVINSLIIYLAHVLFPDQVALGTHLLTPVVGLLQSMLVLTLLVVGAIPVIETVSKVVNQTLSDRHWLIFYYVLNVVALWLTARFAELLGMGLKSWVVAALLALVLNVGQGLTYKIVMGTKE